MPEYIRIKLLKLKTEGQLNESEINTLSLFV